jgi:outer membrane protein, heavy metal efflux system
MSSRRTLVAALLLLGAPRLCWSAPTTLSMDQAVGVALKRNRDAIAARLEIDAAKVERIGAGLYPNPLLSIAVGNLVLGAANSQQATPPVRAGFFGQTITTIGVSEILDVWAKRNLHIRVADQNIEVSRLVVEDALREITAAVRAAFADVVREQYERALSRETHERHQQTVRLSRARQAAGEISAAELNKIELEGLRYQSAAIDAETELLLARQKLAALMGLGGSGELPERMLEESPPVRELALEPLIARALQHRPDLRALGAVRDRARLSVRSARRDAFPDLTLGVAYTHDEFTVSGDNPSWMTLSLSLPIPIFDRNQDHIARARLELQKVENAAARLQIQIRREVADAVGQATRSKRMLEVFQGGGMLKRADTALRVAERSWKAGAISLLELLEAQRTYIETQAQFLRVKYDYQQATINLVRAVGGRPE